MQNFYEIILNVENSWMHQCMSRVHSRASVRLVNCIITVILRASDKPCEVKIRIELFLRFLIIKKI